jgi:hypothetical protein
MHKVAVDQTNYITELELGGMFAPAVEGTAVGTIPNSRAEVDEKARNCGR